MQNLNNIQTACYALIASALILAGLVLVNLGPHLENRAEAAMVISRDNFTLMTAQTREGEEALFVLDNAAGRLLIYRLNVSRSRLEAVGNINLAQHFAGGN